MKSAVVCLLGSFFALALPGATWAQDADVVKVTPQELEHVFATNAALADQKYVGHEIEVTGKVTQVTSETAGRGKGRTTYELRLPRTGYVSLSALFDASQRDELAKLKAGDSVTIRGRCSSPTYGKEAGQQRQSAVVIHLMQSRIVTNAKDGQ
jgi:tRNA_anti-like